MSLIADIKAELIALFNANSDPVYTITTPEPDPDVDDLAVFTADEADPGGKADVVEVFLQDVLRGGEFYGGEEYQSTVVVQVRCAVTDGDTKVPGYQRNEFMKVVDKLETNSNALPASADAVEITASTIGYDDTDGEPLPYGGLTTFNYTTEDDPR